MRCFIELATRGFQLGCVLKHESKEIFRRFWHLEKEIPAEQAGIYYAKTWGTGDQRLQVIMLDPRFNRDDPGPEADTLGEEQWQWLANQLEEPATIRLLVSGYQILLEAGTGSETWAEFPRARRRLFDLIRDSKVNGLVLLTGDQHYGEVCRLRDALAYDAIELQFAGVNQNEKPEFNPNRVSTVAQALHKYCLLDIEWNRSESDQPHLLFRVIDAVTDRPEVIYRINFAELQLPENSSRTERR